MKTVYYRLGILLIFCISGLLLTSCERKPEPDYLIEGAADNGFVASYRAYFALTGDGIEEISGHQYDKLILKDPAHYERFNPDSFYFEATAANSDPATWQYVCKSFPNPTGQQELIDELTDDLTEMGVDDTGEFYIILYKFDEYKIIEVDKMQNITIIDSTYAMFRYDELMELPDGIDLSNLNSFDRHK